MKSLKTIEGFRMDVLSDSERNQAWNEILNTDVSQIGTNEAFYTPQDNLEYFIDSEVETSFEKYECEIRANGKAFKVKSGLCNQQEKIYKAVRKAYNK